MRLAKEGFRVAGPLLAALCCGCGQPQTPSYPAWGADSEGVAASLPASQNAFAAYARAAEEAERLGGKDLTRVVFTNGMRRSILARLSATVASLEAATTHPCSFSFTPRPPFEPAPHQAGWRLLGRCLVWKIQDAVALEQWEEAGRVAAIATKFGFDLAGGGASDASLGFAIVDEAREALAPSLEMMDAESLQGLAKRLPPILAERGHFDAMIGHEHEQMLLAVQYVQDAYRARDFDPLDKELGPDVRAAVEYLREMVERDASERPAYFEGFAEEANERTRWLRAAAALPLARRKEAGEPALAAPRPWWRFSKHFLQTVDPLLEVRDRVVARTRLFAIEAEVLYQIKSAGTAPPSLDGFPPEVTTDPYSGQSFAYRANGSVYSVYSVGSDLRDDGGETDEGFALPDLRLEKAL